MGKIKLALSIMVLLFTVSACRNDSYGDNDDNTSTSSEIPVAESVTGTISATTETTAAKKPATFRETLESELDEKTNRLFAAFVNGDKETLAMLSGAKDISAFDFIDDIEFAGYEIEKSD
ncbi:MAG: hypothetical protein LBI36_03410, partial [Oscillospiraceae bacterium]|nr:hypothetical protein [Oscillospiraceae bacterium]